MKVELGFQCDVPESEFREVDAQTLHCATCDKNVHNISEMTRAEAADLLRAKKEAGEEVCIRQLCFGEETSFRDDPCRRLEEQQKGANYLVWAAAVAVPLLMLAPAEASHPHLVHSPVGWALDLENHSPDGKILGIYLKEVLVDKPAEKRFEEANASVIQGVVF